MAIDLLWEKQYQAWQAMYRLRPYLANCSIDELHTLRKIVFWNILELTDDAKIGMTQTKHGRIVWEEKFYNVRHEYYRRNIDFADAYSGSDLPFKSDDLMKLQKIFDQVKIAKCFSKRFTFSRTGERQWMHKLYKYGKLLLRPASYYAGLHGDIARQDNELFLDAVITPYDYDMDMIDRIFRREFPERGWKIRRHHKPKDHYIYCVSVNLKPRYIVDFGEDDSFAESSVLIHDTQEFTKRLLSNVKRILPNWKILFGPVKYVDPFRMIWNIEDSIENRFFFKNFSFMYQHEYRLVAIPPSNNRQRLRNLNVQIGSLCDIAELIDF